MSSSQEKRLEKQLDVFSPQFLPDTIATIARARDHLSKGKLSGAAELMIVAEERLALYSRVVAQRFLYKDR